MLCKAVALIDRVAHDRLAAVKNALEHHAAEAARIEGLTGHEHKVAIRSIGVEKIREERRNVTMLPRSYLSFRRYCQASRPDLRGSH